VVLDDVQAAQVGTVDPEPFARDLVERVVCRFVGSGKVDELLCEFSLQIS
jgi:hypothetical protein